MEGSVYEGRVDVSLLDFDGFTVVWIAIANADRVLTKKQLPENGTKSWKQKHPPRLHVYLMQ